MWTASIQISPHLGGWDTPISMARHCDVCGAIEQVHDPFVDGICTGCLRQRNPAPPPPKFVPAKPTAAKERPASDVSIHSVRAKATKVQSWLKLLISFNCIGAVILAILFLMAAVACLDDEDVELAGMYFGLCLGTICSAILSHVLFRFGQFATDAILLLAESLDSHRGR